MFSDIFFKNDISFHFDSCESYKIALFTLLRCPPPPPMYGQQRIEQLAGGISTSSLSNTLNL